MSRTLAVVFAALLSLVARSLRKQGRFRGSPDPARAGRADHSGSTRSSASTGRWGDRWRTRWGRTRQPDRRRHWKGCSDCRWRDCRCGRWAICGKQVRNEAAGPASHGQARKRCAGGRHAACQSGAACRAARVCPGLGSGCAGSTPVVRSCRPTGQAGVAHCAQVDCDLNRQKASEMKTAFRTTTTKT